jgi:hypothetical protein
MHRSGERALAQRAVVPLIEANSPKKQSYVEELDCLPEN